jgi:cytochrome c-type biogenesis protein CcmH
MDKRMPRLLSILVAAMLFFMMFAMPVFQADAKQAQPVGGDPALEKRLETLTGQLRCLVCQNQTIADSHADLAIDLKNEIREKMQSGMSDKEIVDYLVARYGDFVLYRPPVKITTWLLWFGPFLFLVVGVAALMIRVKKRAADAELSDAEKQRAAALLDASEEKN